MSEEMKKVFKKVGGLLEITTTTTNTSVEHITLAQLGEEKRRLVKIKEVFENSHITRMIKHVDNIEETQRSIDEASILGITE